MRGKFFIKLSWISLIAIYLVIFAGSFVRMSGSGMGCPDWPKCFGSWIPPTSEVQLPDNYKEVYTEKRLDEVEKFTNYLEKFGFHESANAIRSDESLTQHEEFNAAKTWTEYVNRLFGFLAGNLLLLQMILALVKVGRDIKLFLLTLLNLFLIGFTAWFGSIVVATNLIPWVITVHMVVALFIVAVQILIIQRARRDFGVAKNRVSLGFTWLIVLALIVSFAQVIIGTQVRQGIDVLYEQFPRSEWIENLGSEFSLHRSFAWAVLLVNGLLFWQNMRKGLGLNAVSLLGLLVLLEILTGVALSYMGMPKALQPAHLILASIMFGVQIFALTQVVGKRKHPLALT